MPKQYDNDIFMYFLSFCAASRGLESTIVLSFYADLINPRLFMLLDPALQASPCTGVSSSLLSLVHLLYWWVP